LRDFDHLTLGAAEVSRFLQGQRIQLKDTKTDENEKNVAVFAEGMLMGTGVLRRGMSHMVLHPEKIMSSAQKRFL